MSKEKKERKPMSRLQKAWSQASWLMYFSAQKIASRIPSDLELSQRTVNLIIRQNDLVDRIKSAVLDDYNHQKFCILTERAKAKRESEINS